MSIGNPTEKELQQAITRQLTLAKERDEWRRRAEEAEAAMVVARRLGMSIGPRPPPAVWAMRNERAQTAEAALEAANARIATLEAEREGDLPRNYDMGFADGTRALETSQARVAMLAKALAAFHYVEAQRQWVLTDGTAAHLDVDVRAVLVAADADVTAWLAEKLAEERRNHETAMKARLYGAEGALLADALAEHDAEVRRAGIETAAKWVEDSNWPDHHKTLRGDMAAGIRALAQPAPGEAKPPCTTCGGTGYDPGQPGLCPTCQRGTKPGGGGA